MIKGLPIQNSFKLQYFSVSTFLPLCYLAGATTLLLPCKILIPTPQEPAQSWHPLRPCAHFINGMIWDILRNGILMHPNLLLHWPQPWRPQGLHHQWPIPSSLPYSPSLHPWNPPIHSMVEPPQHLQHHTRNHIWELNFLHYHEIMVLYPYPFLVLITLFFSWIVFIHYCISDSVLDSYEEQEFWID